mmetsp:Transcript_9916/g.14904  ORF Transcript_9916/g.14904 Transcript_9916/m.14904 type:complete len:232 (+) Transcript_9916:24-719(+)
MRSSAALILCLFAFVARCDDYLDDEDYEVEVGADGYAGGSSEARWVNTDITTLLWKLIKDDKYDELEVLVRKNPDLVHVRAEDGRGPLWWAYEHRREDIIELLHSLGIDADAKDGDGLMAREMINGPQASQFAKKLEEARRARQMEAQRNLEQQARFAQFKTCPSCTSAGYGWSPTERKCGNYANRECSGNDSDFSVEYDPEYDEDEFEEEEEDASFGAENEDMDDDDFEF